MMSWNEEKVEMEIHTLKRARQMTKQGLQNRIRTGGSLMQQPKRPAESNDMRRFLPDMSMLDE